MLHFLIASEKDICLINTAIAKVFGTCTEPRRQDACFPVAQQIDALEPPPLNPLPTMQLRDKTAEFRARIAAAIKDIP